MYYAIIPHDSGGAMRPRDGEVHGESPAELLKNARAKEGSGWFLSRIVHVNNDDDRDTTTLWREGAGWLEAIDRFFPPVGK